MIDAFRRDLSHAVRSLRRTPAFTITAILILGLGIGMASAMFTVFQSILLKRLPVQDQDRIVELSGFGQGAATEFPLVPDQYRRFQAQTRTLKSVASFAHWRVYGETVNDGDRALILRKALVTETFFQVLGAAPALGRLFQPEDGRDFGAVGTASIVLSYDTWKRVFHGDSSVIDRHLQEPKVGWKTIIVGVAPPGLDYPRGVEYWMSVRYTGDVVGRLAAGVTIEAARQEYLSFLNNDPDIVKALGKQTLGAQVHTLEQMVVGDVKPALVVLSAAVALLLLLVCVNLGNLLLLRAAGRVRDMAIRRAIGAGTADLVRQLLTECIVLAVAGGTLGIALAQVLLKALVRLAPGGLPRSDLIGLAGVPLTLGGIVTVLTVVLFGVIPSMATLRFDLSSPLHSDTRSGTVGRTLRKIRQALVASQVALGLVVLVGAALLGRSFARLAGLDLGYRTDHLSVLSVSLPFQPWLDRCRPSGGLHSSADSALWGKCADEFDFAFHDQVMSELRTPAAVTISPVEVPPFLGSNVWMARIVAEGQPETEAARNPWFGLDHVGPEYFRTLDLPILKGRGFTDSDRARAPRVAIVTEGVARTLWPTEDVIGKRFRFTARWPGADSLVTIVGVTRDIHFREHRSATPMILRPYRQESAQGYFVMRTRSPLSELMPTIRRAIIRADPGAVLVRAQTLDELIAPELAAPRFNALLLGMFAVAALVLAAIGLYGIMASAVAQQTRELGVRMALGATAERLRDMILGQALLVAGAGAAVGLIGALAGTRLLKSMLFEVSPGDPITLIGVIVLLLGVALLAAYVPARRATRIDPAQALRAE